jgi:hypothetical protein
LRLKNILNAVFLFYNIHKKIKFSVPFITHINYRCEASNIFLFGERFQRWGNSFISSFKSMGNLVALPEFQD